MLVMLGDKRGVDSHNMGPAYYLRNSRFRGGLISRVGSGLERHKGKRVAIPRDREQSDGLSKIASIGLV